MSGMRERRVIRALFAVYCVFVIYGSFIPFRFSADLEAAGHLARR